MIAAAVIAAGVLAPPGVTAGIQADPVCLPVTAQPGHSYPLTVSVSGSGPLTLTVIPAHGTLERRLHQVPASWARFAANPASPGPGGTAEIALTLSVPGGAAPGAYWSDIEAGSQGQAQPGVGGQAVLGAAAATAIVFTVGPSPTPPPPCDALDLAQSTGKFPPWPTKGFATTGWKQVFARERAAGPAPEDMCPTATAGPAARSAPSYCPGAGSGPSAGPAYSPAASTSRPGKTDPPGWAILAGLALLAALAFKLKRRKP